MSSSLPIREALSSIPSTTKSIQCGQGSLEVDDLALPGVYGKGTMIGILMPGTGTTALSTSLPSCCVVVNLESPSARSPDARITGMQHHARLCDSICSSGEGT